MGCIEMLKSPPDASADHLAWMERLSLARSESRAGAGTVLDVLLRHWQGLPESMLQQLQSRSGVSPLSSEKTWEAVLEGWSDQQADRFRCVVVKGIDQELVAAAADPWDPAVHRAIERAFARPLPISAVTSAQLDEWIQARPPRPVAEKRTTTEVGGPIVSFVDSAIRRAVEITASDIHFECDRSGVTVKHRLDGVMQTFARMDGASGAEAVISRIKVLSQLDITERRLPQDGRFRQVTDGIAMDMRVSIMPSVHGEDAVLRLLDKAQFRGRNRGISLESLGFESRRRDVIRDLATEPSGMLLVTGPTGSGKTTTLYAVLSEINSGLEKIITIEDPVEYELEGVLQIPVNEKKGLTFAKGLRSILRHDPDRILVGEIRDAETAEIAVQASLTGHQVFTTVHANSVADVMGRFLHFGLDMFGFTSALNGVVVQRLLRQLCPHCKRDRALFENEILIFERHAVQAPHSVYQAAGCPSCMGSGYAGRFVIAEVHRVDDTLRELVTSRATLTMLKKYSVDAQIESLQSIGLQQVANGQSTLEELKRVVGSL
jgi:general secretion pathway protein E